MQVRERRRRLQETSEVCAQQAGARPGKIGDRPLFFRKKWWPVPFSSLAAAASVFLLVFELVLVFIPGARTLATLRVNVAEMVNVGGKIKLTTCGPRNQLCAKITYQLLGIPVCLFGYRFTFVKTNVSVFLCLEYKRLKK